MADQVRGRVFSTQFALFSLGSAVAAGTTGWALEQSGIGYGRIVWILPGLTVVAALLWGSWVLLHPQAPTALAQETSS